MSDLRVVAAAAALAFAVQPGQRYPQLRVEPELRVDTHTLSLVQRQTLLAVGPDDRIIVAPQMADMIALDTNGKKLTWSVPTGWNRDYEIRWVSRLGWLSGARWGKNTMWVADPGYQQVVLLD